jgi:VWFA-related protein
MKRLGWAFWVFLIPMAAGSPPSAVRAGGQQTPQVPTFRGAITLVPIDVRVIDKNTGKPVTDLKQGDFTIFEDGVRQEIRHFVLQDFAADIPEAGAPSITPDRGAKPAVPQSPLSLTPQTNRTFLLVLGEGRLQAQPAQRLDAAIDFVRTRLLPRDRVAVFAYDRATDFTTNHEQAARLLERFRQENDAITGEIDFQMSGLAALYGSQELPDAVQDRIDRMFQDAGALPFENVGRAENGQTGARTRRDVRARREAGLDAVVAAGRVGPEVEGAGSSGGGAAGGTSWAAFDSFIADNAQTLRDRGNLYAAIAYMRQLEGEKHLVFISGPAMSFPRVEDYKDLAMAATDARVALDVISGGGKDVLDDRLMRSLSEDTGGVGSIAEYGRVALDRVDRATRTGYLLGYYPSNSTWNGVYRNIVVKVNRRDATVLFRRGYHGFAAIPTFDRREYFTRHRLEAAVSYPKDVKDIGVKLRASLAVVNDQNVVNIDARIDPGHLYFMIRGGVYFGRVDIAVISMDEKQVLLGGTYKKMVAHLEYDKQTLALVRKDGIPYRAQIRVPSGTRYVRVVVYDYMTDLIGIASTWVY